MKKVFVGGSKTLKSLPPETVSFLSDLLAEGASFLVGDCMGADALLQAFLREKGATDVCVYTVEDAPRNHRGTWEVKQVKRRSLPVWSFLRQKDKDHAMAADADCAFMLWDGKSKGTFANILEMLYLEKPVSVFLTGTSELFSPASYAELEPYVKPAKSPYIDPTTRRKLLREFMPSELMREHLQNATLSKKQLLDLICFSPVSVWKKQKWLQSLAKRENLLYEMLTIFRESVGSQKNAEDLLRSVLDASFSEHARELAQAIDALQLQAGEVFYIRAMYADKDDGTVHEYTETGEVCVTWDSVMDMIDFGTFVEETETPPDEDILQWFVLEKWVPVDERSMRVERKYYFIGRVLCFAEAIAVKCRAKGLGTFVAGAHFLRSDSFRLPTPLQAGDVLLICQKPAQPSTKAVVLSACEDDVRVLYRNRSGEWTIESLCRFSFPTRYIEKWEPYHSRLFIFPLYYLKRLDPSQYGKDSEVAELLRMRDAVEAGEKTAKQL